MRRLVAACLGWVLGLALPAGYAQPIEPTDAQTRGAAYAQIDAQRARESARLDAEEAQCYQNFAANRCLKDVQSRRTAMLKKLRQQETTLHAQERVQQGAEQRQRIADKAQERLERDAQASAERAERAALPPDASTAKGRKPPPVVAPTDVEPPAGATARPAQGPSPQAQQANRENHARKLADAAAKRQELAKRRLEKTGTPLPTPSTMP